MADQKVSDLPSLNGSAVDPADLLYIVDSSAGTAGSKKITIGQFQLSPYSGGTINGVAYFDGTKVVVSGSDLVFDGTNLGVGTAAPGARVHTVKTSAGAATVGAFLQNSDNTLGTEVRLAFAANTALLSSDRYGWIGYVNTGGTNGGALTFATTPGGTPATEQMRLDGSGNLGIGTNSPAEKLTVAAGGNDRVGASIVGSVTQLRLGSSVLGEGMLVLQYNRTTGAYQLSEGTNGNTGSPDIAVDAAGSVGVGLTSVTSGYKLDVNGAVNARASAANTNGLRVEATAGYVSNLSLFRLGYAEWFIGSANNSASLNISVADGTHASPAMTFTTSGDIITKITGTAPALSNNSTMSFELTSNTSLKIVVRGTDGVTRSATLTLS
jgi:hypothetical protein